MLRFLFPEAGEPALALLIRAVRLPLVPGISKNRRWKTSFRSRCVYKTAEARRADSLWAELLKKSINWDAVKRLDVSLPYVRIYAVVNQPVQISDPSNCVDAVCDVVKTVLPVDDKFYAIFLDWRASEKGNRSVDVEVWGKTFQIS